MIIVSPPRSTILPAVAVVLLAFDVCINPAAAGVITFNEFALEHGSIVDDQYADAPHFLNIVGYNDNRDLGNSGPVDLAIIFDSTKEGTRDPDLEDPWTGGNILTKGENGGNTILGNLLIIAENDTGWEDGIVDNPDDEGTKPAGKLVFDFTGAPVPLFSFSMTLVDIEDDAELNGYFATFLAGTIEIGQIPLAAFINNTLLDGIFYDSTVDFAGDNSANILEPITITELNQAFDTSFLSFDRIELQLNGSGAVAQFNYAVPEPASAFLLLLGGLGFAGLTYRKHRAAIAT